MSEQQLSEFIESRSYAHIHPEFHEIDLNSADLDQLTEFPLLGVERARELIKHRPFRTWGEVVQVPGFSLGLMDDLRSGGAKLGFDS
jgi:DNA uptake protein ComE-like DNA-binding protein